MTQINTHFIMLMGSVCQELGRAQLDGFSAGASAGKTQVIPGDCNGWGWNPKEASSLTGLVPEMVGYRWDCQLGCLQGASL